MTASTPDSLEAIAILEPVIDGGMAMVFCRPIVINRGGRFGREYAG